MRIISSYCFKMLCICAGILFVSQPSRAVIFHPLVNQTIKNQKDMKTLRVRKIELPFPKAKNVPAVMDASGVEWNYINNVGWPDRFPYCPEVKFRIAHTGTCILIQFLVTEQEVKAAVKADNGPVFRDACCEFFLRPEKDGIYYNMETNCIGVMLIEAGIRRGSTREMAPKKILSGVDRWSSLAEVSDQLPEGECTWQLALVIPSTTFFKNAITDFSGKTMTGNFYKTGDGLKEPHYLSWSPIQTEKPDFHTPQFFGKIEFE